jgi:acetylornithine deacetylase/succinyl-diaminopimelate desuccinylase-like protein
MRGSMLTFGLLVAMSARASSASLVPPPTDQQLARDMLKTLVEINTTHAHGSTEAAQAIQGWLLSAGFAAADVNLLAPSDHPTKGNVVVRYRGKHSSDPVLFLGHLDVVEARPEDWSVDPFKLTQQEGWLYGRGTIDMKDGDAALVESLTSMKIAPTAAMNESVSKPSTRAWNSPIGSSKP